MAEKIYLGRHQGEPIYLTKHKWDCKWYWGFGYLGNDHWHFHFSSILEDHRLVSEYFDSTTISNSDWWVIRELFAQAYALKAAYEVFYRGGANQSHRKGVTDLLGDKELALRLKDDMERLLDRVWGFTCQAVKSES